MQYFSSNGATPELKPPGLSLWMGVSVFLHFCLTCALVGPIHTRPPRLSWELGTGSIDAYFVQASQSENWVPLTTQFQSINPAPQILTTNNSELMLEALSAETPTGGFLENVEELNPKVDLNLENTAVLSQKPEESFTAQTNISNSNIDPSSHSTISSIVQRGGPNGEAPRALTCPLPRYPKWAREQGITGTVLLDIWVDERGRPQNIQIAKSSDCAQLDEAARATALKKWRFTPAMSNSKPVAEHIVVAVKFELNQ